MNFRPPHMLVRTGALLAVVTLYLVSAGSILFAADPVPTPVPTRGVEKVIFLTFDDGPFAPGTQQVLDALAAYDARATFFVIGRQALGDVETLETIYKAGHGLANHGFNHSSLQGVSWDFFEAEVMDTHETMGVMDSMCLRPPYGAYDDTTIGWAEELGYNLVRWTVDPQDWRMPGADAIAEHVMAMALPNSIVLLHDGGGDRSQTAEALRILLPRMKAQGWRFKALCRDVPWSDDLLTPVPFESPTAPAMLVHGAFAGYGTPEAAVPPMRYAPYPGGSSYSARAPAGRPTSTPASLPGSGTATPVPSTTAPAARPHQTRPTQPNGAILSPAAGEIVRGQVEIVGFAAHPDFSGWQLDLLGAAHSVTPLHASDLPAAQDSVLVHWDSSNAPNGVYLLRLRVYHGAAGFDEYFQHIVVLN